MFNLNKLDQLPLTPHDYWSFNKVNEITLCLIRSHSINSKSGQKTGQNIPKIRNFSEKFCHTKDFFHTFLEIFFQKPHVLCSTLFGKLENFPY